MAEYIAYPLMMLAAMPVYLWALGTVQYGQWMFLLTITGFGGLAGLGMGPTATRMVAAAKGRSDAMGAIEGARACLAITLVSALALAGVIVIAGWSVGDEVLSKIGSRPEILTIIGFGALLLTIEQIDAVFAGILRGLERFDLSGRLEIGAKLAQVICTAIVAWQTQSLFAVFFTASAIAILRACVKLAAVQRQLSIRWLTPKWSPAEVRMAFGFGKWIWVQSAGSLMFAVADRAMVGSILGAEALARYSIALQLAQQIQTVPAAGAQVLFPAISKRQAAGQDWRRLALTASAAVAGLGIGGTLALLLLGDGFLRLWIGSALASQVSPLLPWLAVAYGVLSFSAGAHYALIGAGKVRLNALLTVIAGLIAAAVIPWAIGQFGLVGASTGRLAYAAASLTLIVAMWRSTTEDASRKF